MSPAPSKHSDISKMYQVYLLKSAKKDIPWNLIYYESFVSLEDAKIREKSLKYFGKAYVQLKLRIKNSLNKIEALNKREGAG